MIPFPSDKVRNVTPRWRKFQVTAELGELGPSRRRFEKRTPAVGGSAHKRNLRAWSDTKTLVSAAELVFSAIVTGKHTDATEAARFITQGGSSAVPALRELAQTVLTAEQHVPYTQKYDLAAQRQFVHAEPRNAIGWTDLALAFAVTGQDRKAAQALTVALRLAPDNRHVLRSAASFYIESGDAERANDLLNRTSATSNDPWLAAAEIATASVADRHSKLAKRAKDQVVRGDFGGHDITELASAVATLELGYGNASRSKKLFRVSMADPTENAVAQAQWAVQHRHISLDLSQQREHTPLAFEAIARTSFTNADWAGCNDALKSWMKDQPFLVLPALIGSYIASELLEVPQEAYEFAKFGLKSNPNAAMLHNNLAVALAHLNRLDEAEQSVLRAIACSKPESVGDAIIIQATKGLVAFRRRNAETGRHLYESAITRAMDAGLKSLARRAYLYLIQEEVYNDPCVAPSALTALQPLDHETPSPVWSELLARVHNNIRVLAVIGDPYGLNRRSASDHCESALRLYGVKLANTGSDPAHFVNAIRPTGSIAPSRPDAPADVRQSFSGHFQTP